MKNFYPVNWGYSTKTFSDGQGYISAGIFVWIMGGIPS